jgi:hypothetical protein
MKALLVLLLCLLVFAQTGCVTQAKYLEGQKRIEGLEQKTKELTDSLNESNSKWAECRIHKYQFMNVGARTFRFDSVTGESCIKLASDADWKNKATKHQSCDCTDFIETINTVPAEDRAAQRKIYCGW